MSFVLLYGPPAVGKLTAARELADLTGFKLFHNHLSVDLAEAVFTRNGPSFERVVKALNQAVFEEAAQTEEGLIFTFVYAYPQDNDEMKWMLALFEARGASTLLVQLLCPAETLKLRIGESSRRAYGKMKDVRKLERLLETYDLFTPYPERPSLQLDTTNTPPAETAATIAAHLQTL